MTDWEKALDQHITDPSFCSNNPQREVDKTCKACKTEFITTFHNDEYCWDCLRHGAIDERSK